ncbi:uncharacterized protein ISCGN_012032 [Ixodes scapularis]
MTKKISIFSFTAVSVLLIPLSNGGRPPYPELNPALGKYQNAPECLPIRETWYSVYRNYVYDPEFGGAAKCGRLTSLGPEQNGSFPMLLEYGHTSIEILSTPVAYEGYDVKNLQYYQAAGENSSLLVYIGYVDCQKCVLFRNSYINGIEFPLTGQ